MALLLLPLVVAEGGGAGGARGDAKVVAHVAGLEGHAAEGALLGGAAGLRAQQQQHARAPVEVAALDRHQPVLSRVADGVEADGALEVLVVRVRGGRGRR